jgi:hypothetical protein
MTSADNTLITTESVMDVLPGIFADPRWRELSRYRLFAIIGGARVGVVLATKKPPFANYAVNKVDFDRLLAGKSVGKIDQAFVVFARINDLGMTYVGHVEADHMHGIVQAMRPRNGPFGPFWTLSPDIAGIADSDDDEPF